MLLLGKPNARLLTFRYDLATQSSAVSVGNALPSARADLCQKTDAKKLL
jgi:hypothetical protein